MSDRDIDNIYIAENINRASIAKLLKEMSDRGVVYKWVPRAKLDSLAPDQNTQGMVAEVSSYKYAELDDLFKIAKERKEQPFFVVLDKIEDPHNLGAVLRSADAAGVHGVIIPKRRAVGLTASVAKVSAGAVEHVAVVRVVNLVRTAEELKDRGVWLVGCDMEAPDRYDEVDLDMPLAIVIGGEDKGLSTLLKKKCDFVVNLPMHGKIESLNASVSAALMMYQVERVRNQKSN